MSDVRRCGWCGARLGAAVALLSLTGGGLAATVWRLRRQGLGWSVGRG